VQPSYLYVVCSCSYVSALGSAVHGYIRTRTPNDGPPISDSTTHGGRRARLHDLPAPARPLGALDKLAQLGEADVDTPPLCGGRGDGNDERDGFETLPRADGDGFAPHAADPAAATAGRRLDAARRAQLQVLVVHHLEVDRLRVREHLQARGGDEERQLQVRQRRQL